LRIQDFSRQFRRALSVKAAQAGKVMLLSLYCQMTPGPRLSQPNLSNFMSSLQCSGFFNVGILQFKLAFLAPKCFLEAVAGS
jgi:hypothetical protein